MLRAESIGGGVDYQLNADMVGLSPLECLDRVIEYSGVLGIRVILDRHSALANNYEYEELWYIPGNSNYSEAVFISDWQMLARRYERTAVIGADLWNEPKGIASWGADDISTDWNLAAERVGQAIQAINQDWLIIVEGIGQYGTWWGGDLEGARTHPIRLTIPNKLVYSIHEYSCDVFNHTWLYGPSFPGGLRQRWNRYFGYLVKENIAPVYVGEYGATMDQSCNVPWMQHWVNYTNGEYTTDGVSDLVAGQTGLSWTFWTLNPIGQVGGILKDDWITVDDRKYKIIRTALGAPLPTYDPMPSAEPTYTSAPTSATPSAMPSTSSLPPSLSPTALPTAPVFGSFYTDGSQIVNGQGQTVRITGITW
jgi:aryl-phospho-beta-D-glucosidase BglC (GH1 family)